MKDLFKTQWRRLVLALVYTLVAVAVYAVMAEIFWGKWYLNLIFGFVIAIIGCVVGYFYAKAGYDASKKEEAATPEVASTETQIEEKPVENQQ